MMNVKELDKNFVAQTYGRFPLTLVSGKGSRVVDDEGKEMPVSADPMLATLQAELAGIELGKPESCRGKLDGILGNAVLFGVSLKEAGLAEKIENYLAELLAGPGAVRATLVKYLG